MHPQVPQLICFLNLLADILQIIGGNYRNKTFHALQAGNTKMKPQSAVNRSMHQHFAERLYMHISISDDINSDLTSSSF